MHMCLCTQMVLVSISETMVLMGGCSNESYCGVLCVGNIKEHSVVLVKDSGGPQDLSLGT